MSRTGFRKARAVLLGPALVVALAGALGAQQTTRADTTRPTVIFDESFPGPQETVLLTDGLVYRVEVEPATAQLSIRNYRRPGQMPLMLMAVNEPSTRGATFEIVPRESAEYRIDVTVAGGDVVRVRIWTDPRESARWARIAAATEGLPHGGVAVRAVYLGPFPAPYGYMADSVRMVSGVGADFCLGVVPRGAWLSGSVGGCALDVTMVNRGADGNAVFVSIAPRWMATSPQSSTQISFVGQIGLGTTTLSHSMDYQILGLEAMAEHALFGSTRFGIEFQGGIWMMSSTVDTHSYSASATHLALGLHGVF